MPTVNSRILSLLSEKRLKQMDLAKYIGVSTSTLNNWLNLGRDIPARMIIPICDFFCVEPSVLLKGVCCNSDILFSDDELKLITNYRKLSEYQKGIIIGRIEAFLKAESQGEIISSRPSIIRDCISHNQAYRTELLGYISAGGGIDAIEDKEIIDAPVPCDFALKIRGDSMEPDYKNGSVIYLQQSDILEYNGEPAAIQVDDDYIPLVFFKKIYMDKDSYHLVSINHNYEERIVPIASSKILGRLLTVD